MFGNVLRFILGGPQAVSGLARPVTNAIANSLPKTYGGSPIRDILTPQVYASTSTPSVKGTTTSTQNFSPYNPNASYGTSTGGAIPSTGGQNTGGGGNGNNGNPTFSQSTGPSAEEQYINSLKDAFNSQKGAFESTLPTYDADLANYTKQVNDQIGSAQTTYDQTNQDINKNYGDVLRQALQTDKEIRNRAQGTYSTLGTLDSSSYMDTLAKQDQALGQNVGNIGTEKAKALTSTEQQFNDYKNKATSQIDAYTQEINRAKAGVRQAIANVDMNQASSLMNYAQQLEQNRQTIANNLMNFKSQLATLQAQGYDVMGNLRKLNGSDFVNSFGSMLSGQLAGAGNRLVVPTNNATGAGYIGPNGKRYNSYAEYLQSLQSSN